MRLLLFIIITIINTVTSDRTTCWMGKCVQGEKDDITPYQSSVHIKWLDVRIQFWISFTYTHTHWAFTLAHYFFHIVLKPSFSCFQSSLPVKHFVWPYWSIFLCNPLTTEGEGNPLLYELELHHNSYDGGLCASMNDSLSVSSPLSLYNFPAMFSRRCTFISLSTNHIGPHAATHTRLWPKSQSGVTMFVTLMCPTNGCAHMQNGYASVANHGLWLVWVAAEW